MVGNFPAVTLLNGAVNLAAVGIALHRYVHESQVFLRRIQNFLSQQNRSRASAEYRIALRCKFFYCRGESIGGKKIQHRRALAARHNQPGDFLKLPGVLHQLPGHPDAVEHFAVHRKVTLDGENANGFSFVIHGASI